MASEIRLAFSHPTDRSEATAEIELLDRISVRDHTVDVEIGAFQAERGVTQRVCFQHCGRGARLDRPDRR